MQPLLPRGLFVATGYTAIKNIVANGHFYNIFGLGFGATEQYYSAVN
jgi:hypothetical protein